MLLLLSMMLLLPMQLPLLLLLLLLPLPQTLLLLLLLLLLRLTCRPDASETDMLPQVAKPEGDQGVGCLEGPERPLQPC